MKKNAIKSALLIWSLCVVRLSAQTVFVEGFEGYSGSNPTLWSRSSTTYILVVTNNATDLSKIHKVSTGLRSVFFRDGGGGGRTLSLLPANAINVSAGAQVVISYWAAQNNTKYEVSDYLMLSAKFGTNAWIDVVKDAGKCDGGGTSGAPLAYTGTRIDLSNAEAYSTDFKGYWVRLSVPTGAATLLLRFTTYSSDSPEDFWLDDIAVEVRPRGTLMTIR